MTREQILKAIAIFNTIVEPGYHVKVYLSEGSELSGLPDLPEEHPDSLLLSCAESETNRRYSATVVDIASIAAIRLKPQP